MARTIAKQVAEKAEAATAPFQYALPTKAGCECVAHILQTLTDLDPVGGGVRSDLPERNARRPHPDERKGSDLPFLR